ncbi:sodium-translocating pyrophosphatase [Natronospora cellulosivora (SeqCode)]
MDLLIFAPIFSVLALAFAWHLSKKLMQESEGNEKMLYIAEAIRKGANTYLKRQYCGIFIFFFVMFFLFLVLSKLEYLSIFVPFAFLIGGFFSALSGFIGMKIATNSNARTANAVRSSLNDGLRLAFSGGLIMGLVVVGLALLHLSLGFYFLNYYFRDLPELLRLQKITSIMLTFGMGASSMALFARVGGGIFTKAADVGADLVGKVEAGIPEDDYRNPAVIADNVGDNVGDVAGMGADLFESYLGSILSTSALALVAGLGYAGVTLPFIIAAFGIVASIIGSFFIRIKSESEQSHLLWILRRGTYISTFFVAFFSFFLIRWVLGMEHISLFYALLSGLLAGNLIGFFTEYFTSASYKPTKKLAASAESGTGTIIINGIALGMSSTFFPVLIIAATVIISYITVGGIENYSMGLYGVGLAAVGLLSTLGITLATDAYGPVADNAGGIVEMSNLEPELREKTDALDSLGNTTAATGKGFAIASAALTALALLAAYKEEVELLARELRPGFELTLSVLNPTVLLGVFIGAMLPFLFAALTMKAVGRVASKVVEEVRRQFKDIKGIMSGETEPDYESCVGICTKGAQREMILPALLGIIAPLIVGFLLGVEGVIGMLAGATLAGFILAIMMANSGGAWDNAKKYIEKGNFGGIGSDSHKSAVVGDTVGDPFKDTSGPSINILIKLLSMVSIVFVAFILQNSLF